MPLKQKAGETVVEAKKRKLVGFAKIAVSLAIVCQLQCFDEGVEANECINIFFVRSQDEIASKDGFCIDPMDLNQFFGEDGKIYGYKDLKISIWLSTVSFHAYADISYTCTTDGGKGITDVKLALENIFGEALLEKIDFLQTFSTESRCIRSIISAGTVLQCYPLNEDSDLSDPLGDCLIIEHQIVRMELHSLPVAILYSRLASLTFLLIDGSSPIDVTDPKWDIYFVVRKMQYSSGEYDIRLLGFATIYRFYHHPDSTRLRLSQILVLPPHQGEGHGRRLLESINSVAVAENVYDLTVEEPSEYLQYVRSCIDTLRLLDFEPIKPAVSSAVSSLQTDSAHDAKSFPRKPLAGPPAHAAEIARQKLKINKTQFLRCWDVLLYLSLNPKNDVIMENFKASFSSRLQNETFDKDPAEPKVKRLIEVPGDYNHNMNFVVYCLQAGEELDSLNGKVDVAGNPAEDQQQQLDKLVDKKIEDIIEIAEKVSSLRRSLGV